MAIFDSWFGAGSPAAVNAPQNAAGGYQDPNQNIVNKLALLAKALQSNVYQPGSAPQQQNPQMAQMLPPVTFQRPQGPQGA